MNIKASSQFGVSKKHTSSLAFTIVELLVVIVVIGVLAAITIVSFTGITQRAVSVSLQSDLDNTAKQLKMFQLINGNYPTTIDCGQADSATNKCVKSSGGATYNHYQIDNAVTPQIFSIYATSGSTSYHITNDSKPTISTDTRESCWDILNAGESTGNGIYWIKPDADAAFPVYCDMTTSGGGWTLLVSNPGPYSAWNTTNVVSLNSGNPSLSARYSILNKGDVIKSNFSGNLQYKIDASSLGHWGGVWQAPYTNTFTGVTAVNNATNIEKYDTWTIETTPADGANSLSSVMPWINNNVTTLSTFGNVGSWWGTLVAGTSGSGYSPAPYMSSENPNPGVIWYWVK